MKNLRILLIAVIAVGFTACSSDDDAPAFELSNANLAGTYDIVFLEGSEVESTTTSSGNTIVVETISFTTDTFTNATYVFSANGTLVSSGSFRLTETITANGSSTTDSEIVILDSQTTFSLNITGRTITIDGDIWEITRFDDDELFLITTDVDVVGTNTFTEETELRLRRRN